MVDAPALTMDELTQAFESPIQSKVLRELAKGKERVIIAVEDITRPTKLVPILERVLSELGEAGVEKEQITFLICNGGHAPMLGRDLMLKLGPAVLSEYAVTNHNPYDNLAETKILVGKTSLRINRNYSRADLKIAIGSITPHNFAGFSAGENLYCRDYLTLLPWNIPTNPL